MSGDLLDIKLTKASTAALLALAALVTVAALVAADPVDQDANQGGTGETTWTGEWNVSDGEDLEYANQTILLDGVLSVRGGRLVLRNVTLVLHGAPLSPQEIAIYDGELVVTDLDGDPETFTDASVVRADDDLVHYYFQAFSGSTLILTNSFVRDCGRQFNLLGLQAALYLATEDATVEATEFYSGYGGIFIDGVDPTVRDCYIHENDWVGIYVDNIAAPTIEDCRVEDNLREGVVVKSASFPVFKDCSVRGNLRGMIVDSAFAEAWDTDFSNNQELDIDLPSFAQVKLINCTVSTSGKPVRMEESSITSTGGSFDIERVNMTGSVFLYQQFLTVTVTWSDSGSTPIPGVDVKVVDAEDNEVQLLTGPDGSVTEEMLVMEYKNVGPNLQTTGFNPFRVTVSYNLVDREKFPVDLRYSGGVAAFQYHDTKDPRAVPPTLSVADVGVNVTLDGSASSDNVAIETWNWSFEEYGGAVYLEGEQVSYGFRQAKVYTITLRVSDTSGRSGTSGVATFDLNVRDRTPPTADAGGNVTVEQGTTVLFDGGNSTDNVGVVEWIWSFTYGDAPRSLTGETNSWTFQKPGAYPVVLLVKDDANLTDTDSMTITVLDTISPTSEVAYDPELPDDRKLDEILQVLFTVQDAGGGTVFLHYRVNDEEWQVVTGGLALSFGGDLQYGDGTYEIEYYAEDAAGNDEDLKTVATFTVDATPPTFSQMDPPIDTLTVTEETYTIKGRTEAGATLTINSQTVAVGPDGAFSHQVTLEKGENNFFLLAEDAVGNTDQRNIAITLEKYDTTPGDDDGGNIALIAGVVLVVVVVLIVLVYLLMVRRRE